MRKLIGRFLRCGSVNPSTPNKELEFARKLLLLLASACPGQVEPHAWLALDLVQGKECPDCLRLIAQIRAVNKPAATEPYVPYATGM